MTIEYVMAGLVSAIPILLAQHCLMNRVAWHTAGHDKRQVGVAALRHAAHSIEMT
jgi:hypothetical protein